MGLISDGCGSLQDLDKASYRELSNENIVRAVKVENEDPIPVSGTFTSDSADTPTIYNVTTPGTPDTETSQALSANTKKFTIQTRGTTATMKLAFTSGQSGTNFITVPKSASFEENDLNLTSGLTLYFQTDVASAVVEILEWV